MGFYPIIELLSSKLFYANALSMQLSYDERHKIRKYRFVNRVLLQNLPLIAIQIWLILIENEHNQILDISLFFSMLSMFILLPKLVYRIKKSSQSKTKTMYTIQIRSPDIRAHHQYCHQLLADALVPFFMFPIQQIETLNISKSEQNISHPTEAQFDRVEMAIVCTVQISSNESQERIDSMMKEIANHQSDISASFKAVRYFIVFTIVDHNICTYIPYI